VARCGTLALALVFSAQAQKPSQHEQNQQPTAPAAQADDTQKSAASAPSPGTAPAPNPIAQTPQPAPSQPAAPEQGRPAQAPQQTPPAPVAQPPAAPAAPATLLVPSPAAPTAPQPSPAVTESEAAEAAQGGITEEEVKQLLVGKALYLRGGYLDNSLSFDEHGRIIGHSPQGSYTLSAIQIERVRLTKHKVELEGARYGLHFLGQLAFEDASSAYDRVRITPKKKMLRITIDREIVVKPKKVKEPKAVAGKANNPNTAAKTIPATPVVQGAAPPAATPTAATPAPPAAQPAPEPAELSAADQLKASIAAAPEAERPADAASVTTTLSPAHATKVLKEALDQIFAQGLDDRMMAAMPDFWKLYYQAVAAKTDYRPKDPSILRQNTVDQKAVLLTKFEPDSNEFAQAGGVAGMALYHTVIGPDGKAGEIAVARPIGFGLDENAVAAIRKASFQPATKDGKPVPVLLDLVVQFRIFSKRTAVHAEPEPTDKATEPVLPGPYSVPQS
jgi:TonB family protein